MKDIFTVIDTLPDLEDAELYDYLLGNSYYISSEYEKINDWFKTLICRKQWDAFIALRYYKYLLFGGWEYECIILRNLLLQGNLTLASEFCLDTHLKVDGIDNFRDNAVWRGIDYDDSSVPESQMDWDLRYDQDNHLFEPESEVPIDFVNTEFKMGKHHWAVIKVNKSR